MKDEIKEILDRLKRLCYDNYCLEFSVDYIERKEEKLLLDYITNLQEENENNKRAFNLFNDDLKNMTYQFAKAKDEINKLQQENENLKDFNQKLQATKDRLDKYDKENTILIKDYKSRCEKLELENKVLKEQMVAMVQPNYVYGIELQGVDKDE